jgi:hypothetical protein
MYNSNPSPLITISPAQLNGFIAIATKQYGAQVGLLSQYMQYGDKAQKKTYNNISMISPMLKTLSRYNVSETRSWITFSVPNTFTLSSCSVSVAGYGVIGTTSWQGSQTATALNLANQINLAGQFYAYSVLGFVVIQAPINKGNLFNGITAVVTNIINVGLVDPAPISWTVTEIAPPGGMDYQMQPYSTNIPITWNTNLNTTMNLVVAAVPIAAPGFTASWNSGTGTFIVTPPIGSGATWNGQYGFIQAYSTGGGYGNVTVVPTGSEQWIGANEHFTGGSNGTPTTTTIDLTFANGLSATTFCLTYSQIFEIMEFINKRLGLCYDINQVPALT